MEEVEAIAKALHLLGCAALKLATWASLRRFNSAFMAQQRPHTQTVRYQQRAESNGEPGNHTLANCSKSVRSAQIRVKCFALFRLTCDHGNCVTSEGQG